MGTMRDDMAVLTAIVQRIDGTLSGLVNEIRATHAQLRWYPDFGQWLKLGSLLRRTDLDDEQTEAVFGGVQGEGCA
jgi:hypothetical protein